MSNTKFTDGPWKFVEDKWGDYIIEMEGARELKQMCDEVGNHKTPDTKADWHLIASAPDLYEALELILSDEDYSGSIDALLLANSALAKARGES